MVIVYNPMAVVDSLFFVTQSYIKLFPMKNTNHKR